VAIDAANFIIFISKNGKRSLKITILVCFFYISWKKAAKLPNLGTQKKKRTLAISEKKTVEMWR